MSFISRLEKLQDALHKLGCDAFIIEDKISLLYLTGLELSAGKLLVHAEGAELLVDQRYFELCKKSSPFPVFEFDPSSLEAYLTNPKYSAIRSLAFDAEKTSYKNFESLSRMAQNISRKQNCAESLKLIPIESPLKQQRAIKDAEEIKVLKEAAKLGSEGFKHICTLLKAEVSEEELSNELEIFWKRRGSKSLAFEPIIAFGQNSSMPHYRAGKARLKHGDLVLIDIGVNYKHYHSDMTRTLFFGKPDKFFLQIHHIVEEALKAALSLCKPGVMLGELDNTARSVISEAGYGQNFTHSLGHGLGLEIHEFPSLKNVLPFNTIPLSPCMVITIEPGIYIPNLGGVRIEDTIVITKNGYESLTNLPTSAKNCDCYVEF